MIATQVLSPPTTQNIIAAAHRLKRMAALIAALVLLAMVAVGSRRAYRDHVAFWPVLAIVIYLNLVYAGTLAMARYSMPLYPTLMVLAAAGVGSVASRLTRRNSNLEQA